MNFAGCIRVAFVAAAMALCLFEYSLGRSTFFLQEYETAVLKTPLVLLGCLALWCGAFLNCYPKDIPLLGLLLVAVVEYFVPAPSEVTGVFVLLASVLLGRGSGFVLTCAKSRSEGDLFLFVLIILLAFPAWWHLDASYNFYSGPRWMGLWNNPNTYGAMMGTGFVLAVGMFVEHCGLVNPTRKLLQIMLIIAAAIFFAGLILSYSRGSWAGTAGGLLYLAWIHGKLKWKLVLAGFLIGTAVAYIFWNATPDDAAWYVKRLDLGRPSAQHRVAAWCGAMQIMRDHPFGIGWNNAAALYQAGYSPPEDGAGAITTNDYLMLGTQLGFAGVFCFVIYVGFCFKKHLHLVRHAGRNSKFKLRSVYHAGVAVLLVTFWFDGGLFFLPTATIFWVLLELGGLQDLVIPRVEC